MRKATNFLLAKAGVFAGIAVASMFSAGIAHAQRAAGTPGVAEGAAPASAAAPVAAAPSAERGHDKAAMCTGCHSIVGYQASFPEVYKVPMISGQGAKYIVAALTEYKKGERKHPTMRAVATSLSDADMADLAAFYSGNHLASGAPAPAPDTLAKQPSAEVAALLAKGACSSCHGANFSKPIDPGYPKIAGQHADYLFAALRAYGTANHQVVGRSNAIMAGQVKQFTREELKAIAQYLSTLPGDVHVVPQSKFR